MLDGPALAAQARLRDTDNGDGGCCLTNDYAVGTRERRASVIVLSLEIDKIKQIKKSINAKTCHIIDIKQIKIG